MECVIKLDEKDSNRKHSVSLFIDRNLAVYIDFFGIEYIPQEVLNKIWDESITNNIFRIQDNEPIMCEFHCIPFIEHMLARKTLLIILTCFLRVTVKRMTIIYKYFKCKYGRRCKPWV